MKGPYVKCWDPARDGGYREGKQVRKTSVGWQNPRAPEAEQGKGTGTDKSETETEKQPRREGGDQKGEALRPPSLEALRPELPGQLRGRRKPFQTGGWGWKCQAAGQVAMATETKRRAEKRLGQRPQAEGPQLLVVPGEALACPPGQELRGCWRTCNLSGGPAGSVLSRCQDGLCRSPAWTSTAPSVQWVELLSCPSSWGDKEEGAGVGGTGQPTSDQHELTK